MISAKSQPRYFHRILSKRFHFLIFVYMHKVLSLLLALLSIL